MGHRKAVLEQRLRLTNVVHFMAVESPEVFKEKTACEGEEMNIDCTGDEEIFVVFANYGRTEEGTKASNTIIYFGQLSLITKY